MNLRKAAVAAAGVLGMAVPAAVPAQAAPASPSACQVVAFGHTLPIACGSNTLAADWNGDHRTDEVFAATLPNHYIYRLSATSNGPVRVSNGRADSMLKWEIRPSGQRRVYAVTATQHVYYSYYGSSGWSEWYLYHA
ncbi:hypothetical protein [Streptomyces lydicus]|uniref:Uncharacterized protein n=1 Tax=Streptomyces lydicus TaxID=47763 RepID=A0A1D7VMT7_9ACTN|nr:hypothetical protein [Streptomyces lydicus]AOP48066.1 hypothetical protein SL103_19155 [Streptomyces lydicus]